MTTCNTSGSLTKLSIAKGESVVFRVTAREDGLLYDATGAKVYFTIRENLDDETPIIQKKTQNAGGSNAQVLVITPQTGANKGRIEIYLLSSDTDALVVGTSYVADAWLVSTTGSHNQILKDTPVCVEPTVTLLAERT